MISVIVSVVIGIILARAGLGILVTGVDMISVAINKIIKMFKKEED